MRNVQFNSHYSGLKSLFSPDISFCNISFQFLYYRLTEFPTNAIYHLLDLVCSKEFGNFTSLIQVFDIASEF